ncbi:MAG: LPS export ABC transporter permease LptG [Novosphingobium sp.]|nr:LPS export ABC transporter permease LptG [Novosphingobium sp.]
MQLEFFPSRTLALYLARLFVTRVLGVLVMLVLILQTLDLLSESGKIFAHPGNGEAQLWTYVGLRMPELIATFLPYSVLLATLFTLVPLNQNSEIVSMRAAGLSAHQILAPLVLTGVIVAGASFAFNERIATRSAATLKAWENADYGAMPRDSGVRVNVYVRDGPNILTAGRFTGSDKPPRLDGGVTWYRRDPHGIIVEEVRAPSAEYANPGWRFAAPERFDVGSMRFDKLPAPIVLAASVTPQQLQISSVDPDTQDIVQLSHSIAALKAGGRRTNELQGAWWHKLSGPLAAMLMPLLGAIAAFGLARSGQVLIRAVLGMMLGFAYFIVDNAALAMGNFGGYPPLVAAWAPFVLFVLIGETVLIRTEE